MNEAVAQIINFLVPVAIFGLPLLWAIKKLRRR